MPQRFTRIAVLAAVTATVATAAVAQEPEAVPPTFRAETRLIPLDVRVLDRDGRPVTDLTAADFTIEEDDVPQEIRLFATQVLAPADGVIDGALRRRTEQATVLAPQDRRVFLFYLSRGDLMGPSRGIDGILHFVRNRLLPQDQVAVTAWNRATDFTTDHDRIAAVLERFKEGYRKVDRQLVDYFRSPVYVYGDRTRLPGWLQADIDAIFAGPEASAMRTVAPTNFEDSDQIHADLLEMYDAFNWQERDPFAAAELERLGVGFEEFLQDTQQTMQDQANLYAAIEYLRHIEGEKHLVYVTEYGMHFERWEFDRNLARVAADGRVVLHTIRTGGTEYVGFGPAEDRRPSTYSGMRAMRPLGPAEVSRNLAEYTGGRSDANRFPNAAAAADQIDAATRFQYLLGYYPADATWDGEFRNVKVSVNRSGVTVLHRFGYFAREDVGPLDRRGVVTYARISTAASTAVEVPDLGFEASATYGGSSRARHVLLEATIDITRVTFERRPDGMNVAVLDIAAFCLDRGQQTTGSFDSSLEISAGDERLAELRQSGVPVSVTIPVSSEPESVKLVVYDYADDLTGSRNVPVGN